jgi:uncharacterized phiE125 gp8 family phage protein
MGYLKVSTPVATEPITLAEVKRHLRIYDDGYNDTQAETITTRAVGASVVTGSSVDIQGCEATVWANVGIVAAGGKLDVAIHHSDDNNTFTLWDSFAQIPAAGSVSKNYTGGKRYIKAIATITVNTITFGVNVQTLAGDPVTDAELSNIITRAREEAEEVTRLALAPQTLEIGRDSFPSKDSINLPRPPLTSVTTFDTYDSSGTKTTLTATTQYLVDADSTPGKLVLPYGATWPSGADYPVNPIRIKYVCGYTALPQRLKTILLYHVGLLYKFRDTAIPDADRKALEQMYNFYRVSWFGGEQ